MHRFFVDDAGFQGEVVCLEETDARHARRVLRLRPGEEVVLMDGARRFRGEILDGTGEAVACRLLEELPSTEPALRITLFQGLPKAEKMELIIQKAVELGVYEIIPVVTARTIVKLDAKKEAKKLARWQLVARSAAKQSGRGMIPKVAAPISFKEAVAAAKKLDMAVMPYERAKGMDAARGLVHSMRGKKSIGIFIGPEGGFDCSEVSQALAANIETMTLGQRILRTETAGLTVLSILMFELEEN